MDYVYYVLHFLVALLFPPLLRGVIVRTKAKFAGRVGAPLLQPYYDLYKLLLKGFVFSDVTTWIFRIGPVVVLVTSVVAALIVPFGHHEVPFSFAGDVILFAYLFGLHRFFLSLAALDVGSSFEGMGTAREVTFACLAEPALFFGLLVTAKLSSSLQMSEMFGLQLAAEWETGASSLLLVLVSWFVVMLAENSRIPIDDPNTHLELTMIHEVMILDHGGPVLGLLLYGAAIKLFLYATLIVRIAIPFPNEDAVFLNWCIFLVGTLFVAFLIGVIESIMARLKMPEVPKLLATACVLSALGLVLLR
jgi:formate hydrogenlyase subunit 4